MNIGDPIRIGKIDEKSYHRLMTIESDPNTPAAAAVPASASTAPGTGAGGGTVPPRHARDTDSGTAIGTGIGTAAGTTDGTGTAGPVGTAAGTTAGTVPGTLGTGPKGAGTNRLMKIVDHASMWPTSITVGGFAAQGQHLFARMIDISDPYAWAATGLFEAVMIGFLVRGYLRARDGLSPALWWFVATTIGVVSIGVQLLHSTNIQQAVFYGSASAFVLLLWFGKLYDSYRKVLRDGNKVISPMPKYGRVWLLMPRLAWRGMLVGTAVQSDDVQVTLRLAWEYIATNRTAKLRGIRRDLRKITAWNAVYARMGLPTIELPTHRQVSEGGLVEAPPALEAVPAAELPESVPQYRMIERQYPDGHEVSFVPVLPAAGTAVPQDGTGTNAGASTAVEAGTAVPAITSTAPPVLSAGTELVPADRRDRTGIGTDAGTKRTPRPPTIGGRAPVSPAPAGPRTDWVPDPVLLAKCATLVDDLIEKLLDKNDPDGPAEDRLRFYRKDLLAVAVGTDPSNPKIDEKWAEGTWLTRKKDGRDAPPTKDECIALCRRGGAHALKIAQITKALRAVHVQNG